MRLTGEAILPPSEIKGIIKPLSFPYVSSGLYVPAGTAQLEVVPMCPVALLVKSCSPQLSWCWSNWEKDQAAAADPSAAFPSALQSPRTSAAELAEQILPSEVGE